jgi:protease YdgD
MRALLILLSAASPLLPGIGAEDPRVPVPIEALPWRALGRVQTELGERCTGFLIAPLTVLTAAHCLYRPGPGSFVQPGSVHFLRGYDRGAFAAHAVVRAYRIAPGYDPRAEQETAGADWAVLTLDAPAGSAADVLPLAAAVPATGTPAMLGGYGQDRAERIVADEDCAVLRLTMDGQGRRLLRHGCAGTRGTSGAPLLVRDAAGAWVVAGVQIAAEVGASGGLAIPLTNIQ